MTTGKICSAKYKVLFKGADVWKVRCLFRESGYKIIHEQPTYMDHEYVAEVHMGTKEVAFMGVWELTAPYFEFDDFLDLFL